MSLILRNLGRKINRKWIIRDISLQVNDGECLALLGPSGCGKSSTLRIIAGLDKPNEGSIYLNDENITNTSPVKRRIGMVFQSYALFPHLTVAQNLTLGLKIRNIPRDEQTYRVSNILAIMQLSEYSNRKPSELSGGQRQRIALARALLREPFLYLLDEPMSNLDAQLREELRPELRRLILSGNQPVIYVTHDQHEAMAMANRIAVLKEGRLEQIGSPKDLYQNPSSIFVANFIGRPQINMLPSQSEVIIGIRPEDLYFDSSGIECRLLFKEWLGNNQLLILESKYGLLRMSCDVNQDLPERIIINWNKEKEHKFYTNSGGRLENSITDDRQ